MFANFLKANCPLTKQYERLPDGTVLKTPYPHVSAFTSIEEPFNNIADFAALLIKHSAANNCLLKGTLTRQLNNESRAGATNTADSTHWLCLDVDGLPDTWTAPGSSPVKITPDALMQMLGMGDVSYVLQWSASQNITSTTDLRFHIFVLLTTPVPAPVLKQWLIHLNHNTPVLQQHQTLTKTGHALHWPLDVTACQNDKLIYIAPPLLKNIKHPLGRIPRISAVTKSLPTLTFNASPNATHNQATTAARIQELRDLAGLPARKFVYKSLGTHQVLTRPESATITGMRNERGFVYFNLNGGDSWGYFHPEDNADYIHNFKGEPVYLTKELLPDYWASITAQASRTTSTGITYLVFLDRRSNTYYRGTYDQGNDVLEITPAKNETQVRHFAEQNGVPLGSFIPEWDLIFDPQDSVRVDFDNRVINTFQLSPYMKVPAKKVTKCPPLIFRVIHNALGSDADCTEHFINWLAFILQNRTRTMTAWVLHGTEGTGKGVLMNRIIRPIFGHAQTANRRMEELDQPYNSFMRNALIVFIDEVEAKAFANKRGVMAKLRTFIAEPTVPIRDMYSTPIEAPNHSNWMFASNRPEPVLIPREDRRYNVGKYQPVKLATIMTRAEVDAIEHELQTFHDFLLSYPVDTAAAQTPLDNEDRQTMIAVGESSIDTVVNAFLEGSMEFFFDQLPSTMAYSGNAAKLTRLEDYKHALKALMARTDPKTGQCNVSRDELHAILDYVVGDMPSSPNKFTSLLKHHRLPTKRVWCDSKAVHGISITFKDTANFKKLIATHFPQPKQPAKPGAKK